MIAVKICYKVMTDCQQSSSTSLLAFAPRMLACLLK